MIDEVNGVSPAGLIKEVANQVYDKDQQDAIDAIEKLLAEAKSGSVRAVAFICISGSMSFTTSFAGAYHAEQYFGAKMIKQHVWAMMQGIHPSQIAAKQAEREAKNKLWKPGMPGRPPGI